MSSDTYSRSNWQKALILALVVLGLVITCLFGMRAWRSFMILRHRRMAPLIQTDVGLIREWMTIPYIAHVYRVPDRLLYDSLGIAPMEPHKARRVSIFHLNQQLFPGQPEEALRRVKVAILEFQANDPSQKPYPEPPRTRIP